MASATQVAQAFEGVITRERSRDGLWIPIVESRFKGGEKTTKKVDETGAKVLFTQLGPADAR